MENASKALLMAGGILIAILIIALLVRSFTSVSIFQKAKLTEEEQQQLLAFNEQYTKYLNQYVYGTEVLSLINKYSENGIAVYVNGVKKESGTYEEYCKDTKYYKCTSVGYDESTGRVNSICFNEVTISSIEQER